MAQDYGINLSNQDFLESLFDLALQKRSSLTRYQRVCLWIDEKLAVPFEKDEAVLELLAWMTQCCTTIAEYYRYQGHRYYPETFKGDYLILAREDSLDCTAGIF